MDYIEYKILSQDMDFSDDDQQKQIKDKKTSGVSLYSPSPGKFLNFNFDKMYSKTHVCGNCNIIYMLIEDFLHNFEDGEAQCKIFNLKICFLRINYYYKVKFNYFFYLFIFQSKV